MQHFEPHSPAKAHQVFSQIRPEPPALDQRPPKQPVGKIHQAVAHGFHLRPYITQ